MPIHSHRVLEVIVPPGAKPGCLLGIVTQRHPVVGRGEMSFVEMPEGGVPRVLEVRLPVYIGDGWETPSVLERAIIHQRQALTEDELLRGFANLHLQRRRLQEWPLLVVRVPAPRLGESLFSGILERFHECDVRARARDAPPARGMRPHQERARARGRLSRVVNW